MLQIANQSGYIDIHFDRIRDTAQRRLNQVQQAAVSSLPGTTTTTTNVDGEEIENFDDQSSSRVTDAVGDERSIVHLVSSFHFRSRNSPWQT